MDEFYRIVFAFPRTVRDLVRGFLPEQWTAGLDLDALEPLPAAYVSDRWWQRHGDRVWKIPYRPGGGRAPGAYAVLILEFQSTVDPTMPVRMLVYAGLLMQELLRHRRGLSAEMNLLPRTLPVVIHSGRRRWSAPSSVTEMTMPGPGMEELQPRMSYWLLDERRQSPHALPKDNLVSFLIRLGTDEGEALERTVAGLASLLADPIDAQIRHAFRDWLTGLDSPRVATTGRTLATMLMEEPMTLLESVNERLGRYYAELEQQAIERGLARGREQGMARGREQGIEQGMARGREQGIEQGMARGREATLVEERALLHRMAERRFGNDVAAQLAALLADTDDSDGFAAIADAIVDSDSGDELVERLG